MKLEEALEHYSDKIENELIKLGWKKSSEGLEKDIKQLRKAGELSSGDRTVIATWSKNRRYLKAALGFNTLFDIDGRQYENNPKKGAMEFEKKLKDEIKKEK